MAKAQHEDEKLREYREAQASALESMCPIAAEALVKFFQKRMRESKSLGEIGGLVMDLSSYVENVSEGRFFGPYPYACGMDEQDIQKVWRARSNILRLPPFSLRDNYRTFAEFITDVHKQTEISIDPLSAYLTISNNTLIRFIRNSEDPPAYTPKKPASRAMEKVRDKILLRLGISGDEKERLKRLPIYRQE